MLSVVERVKTISSACLALIKAAVFAEPSHRLQLPAAPAYACPDERWHDHAGNSAQSPLKPGVGI